MLHSRREAENSFDAFGASNTLGDNFAKSNSAPPDKSQHNDGAVFYYNFASLKEELVARSAA